jgi:hypothetical protein
MSVLKGERAILVSVDTGDGTNVQVAIPETLTSKAAIARAAKNAAGGTDGITAMLLPDGERLLVDPGFRDRRAIFTSSAAKKHAENPRKLPSRNR